MPGGRSPPWCRIEALVHYRMYSLYRVQILATFALATIIAVGLAIAAAMTSPPVLVFVALWVAALLWNGYWFLLRIVYDLVLDGDVLRWRTPVRSGTVKLSDVVELRPSRLGSNAEVIEFADRSRLIVFVRKGFKAFADEMKARRPGLPIRLGFQARLAERLPGSSGFKRKRV